MRATALCPPALRSHSLVLLGLLRAAAGPGPGPGPGRRGDQPDEGSSSADSFKDLAPCPPPKKKLMVSKSLPAKAKAKRFGAARGKAPGGSALSGRRATPKSKAKALHGGDGGPVYLAMQGSGFYGSTFQQTVSLLPGMAMTDEPPPLVPTRHPGKAKPNGKRKRKAGVIRGPPDLTVDTHDTSCRHAHASSNDSLPPSSVVQGSVSVSVSASSMTDDSAVLYLDMPISSLGGAAHAHAILDHKGAARGRGRGRGGAGKGQPTMTLLHTSLGSGDSEDGLAGGHDMHVIDHLAGKKEPKRRGSHSVNPSMAGLRGDQLHKCTWQGCGKACV